MKRRHVFAACAGIVPLSGCSLYRTESGNIQIGNSTEQEVWMKITIQTEGRLFSEPETVYYTRVRAPPTEEYRSTITDVAPPGTYEVQIQFESTESDQESGIDTTQWTPSGNQSESLIVNLTPDFDVEFLTQSGS